MLQNLDEDLLGTVSMPLPSSDRCEQVMKIGSLFSGYAGLDLAVAEHFNAETAWFAEWEDTPSKVLAHHWPDVPNYRDVTQVDWSTVEPVDIITGGYPCQPFSAAGQRKGIEDERHLWPYVAESVDILRPEWLVFENVRGHLTLGFDQVLRDLHLLKYDVRWEVIKASDISAPHRRERIFILGKDKNAPVRSRTDRRGRIHRNTGGRWIFPTSSQDSDDGQRQASPGPDGQDIWRDSEPRESQESKQQGSIRLEINGGSRCKSYSPRKTLLNSQERSCSNSVVVPDNARNCEQTPQQAKEMDRRNEGKSLRVPSQNTGCEPSGSRPGADSSAIRGDAAGEVQSRPLVGVSGLSIRPGALRGASPNVWSNDQWRDLRIAEPGNRFRVFILATNTEFLRGSTGRPATPGQEEGRRTPSEPVRRSSIRVEAPWGQYESAIRRWEQTLGRPAPGPTQLTERGNHRLSPVFVEWMMGLPEGWVTDIGLSRAEQLKALGNGVVPQQALAALDAMGGQL